MRGKLRLMCIFDFFNMKTLLQLSLAQKLISSKCVLFKNSLLSSETVPLMHTVIFPCYLLYQGWIEGREGDHAPTPSSENFAHHLY